MATAPPPGSGQIPQLQGDNSPPNPQLSWEGDRMFNIYIYDYCYKRGFRKTARELLAEAEIPPESTPPINARQGLLFEWWSVFWVLFQAKSSGQGTEDALLYTQMTQYAQQRQQAPRLQSNSQALPSSSLPLGQQGQPPMQQPPPPMGRPMNGLNRPGPNFMQNGPMANGVGPSSQAPVQPGVPSFSLGPQGPQPNGIQGPQGMPTTPGQPPSQPQNFSSLLSSQRPPLNGPPQQRGQAGPFQSPTMAHSPQTTGNAPGQPQQPQQQSQQAPMGQLGPGPSPHMAPMHRGGMLPPNGQGMNSMNPGQQPGGTPTPGYQVGRPPSRTNTPGQGGMLHPSPSLTARQPPGSGLMPGNPQDGNINTEIMRIPTAILTGLKQEVGISDKDLSSLTQAEKQRLVNMWRQRTRNQKPGALDNAAAGPSNLLMQPPNQQQRNQQQQQQPQSQQQQQQSQQQQQQQQQRNKRNSTSPGEEHDTLPRNESSPPERKRVRRSPMEQSITPMTYSHQQSQQQQQQQQQQGPGPGQQQQPGGPQSMQQMPGMGPQGMVMMRGQMGGPMGGGPMGGNQMGAPMAGNPMNGGPPQPGQTPQMGNMMNMGMNQQQAPQQMGLNPQAGHSAMMSLQMQNPHLRTREAVYRNTLHDMHKATLNAIPGNPNSPASDPAFNPGGPGPGGQGGGPQFNTNNRMQNKPNMGMMPPPSPAMNGPPKDQPSGPNKDNKNQNPSNGHPDGSPRNQPLNQGQTPNPGTTAPPTPVPMMQQTSNPPQQQPPNNNPPQNNMAPSPSSLMGGPPTMNSGPPPGMGGPGNVPPLSGVNDPMGANIFSTDFIQSVASSLDDFDPGLFRPDGDINFERDFGQWFSGDEVSSLDIK